MLPEVPNDEGLEGQPVLCGFTSPDYQGKVFKAAEGEWVDQDQFPVLKKEPPVPKGYVRVFEDNRYCDYEDGFGQFSDASFQSTFDYRSVSGYCTFFGGAVVDWGSQTQSVVAQSTMEAEILATFRGNSQMLHVRTLLQELGELSHFTPTIAFEDNVAAKIVLNSPGKKAKAGKHIERVIAKAQQWVRDRVIRYAYCRTDLMLADVFTKQLDYHKFVEFRRRLMNIR